MPLPPGCLHTQNHHPTTANPNSKWTNKTKLLLHNACWCCLSLWWTHGVGDCSHCCYGHLQSGKVTFSYIYGIGVMGCIAFYCLLSLMATQAQVTFGAVVSVLGYCLLPMVVLSGINVLITIQWVYTHTHSYTARLRTNKHLYQRAPYLRASPRVSLWRNTIQYNSFYNFHRFHQRAFPLCSLIVIVAVFVSYFLYFFCSYPFSFVYQWLLMAGKTMQKIK